MLESARDLSGIVAHPSTRVASDIEPSLRNERKAVLSGLVVRAGTLYCSVVLGDMKINSPRPESARHFVISGGELIVFRPVKPFGKQPILGRIEPHGE